MGKLVVLNGTDDEWKIAVYPHVVGKISKEEKKIKVRTIISYKYSYLIFSSQKIYYYQTFTYDYRLKARHAPFQSLAS